MLSAVLLAGVCAAQQSGLPTKDEKPPLPNPILRPAPALSQWTVRKSLPTPKANGTTDGQNAVSGSPGSTLAVQKTVIKSGKVYFETSIDSDGKKWDKWNINGAMVAFEAATGRAVVVHDGPESLFYQNYARAEFPGFEWISPQNYVAFQSVGKSKCFIFRNSFKQEDGSVVITTAAIDSETQLPVLLDEDGFRTLYEFGPPPATPLVVPEKVTALLKPEPISGPIPRNLRKRLTGGT